MNPFKVGDKIRSVSNDNPTDRPKGNIYTVSKIYGTDVYYKYGYAAHYSKFELVSEKEHDTLIKIGSHWERSYTSESGKAGEIIQITGVSPNMVKWCNNNCSVSHTYFLNNFHPRPDLDNPKVLHQYWKDLYDQGIEIEWTNTTYPGKHWYSMHETMFSTTNILAMFNAPHIRYRIKPSIQETIQQSKPQEKEKSMTIQQLLQSIFGAEKPTTDYDRRPAILVVAYNRDGSQIGTAVADTLDDVKSKVADTPELWGCKVLTYTLDQEVSVDVPVKATKAKVAKVKE